jgi:hypothetical protein
MKYMINLHKTSLEGDTEPESIRVNVLIDILRIAADMNRAGIDSMIMIGIPPDIEAALERRWRGPVRNILTTICLGITFQFDESALFISMAC